ncbi:MAG: phosphotransferase, partial [Opitutaceae bacterium]|nr:phosphotransferase [Cytophagales bacterium]
MKISNRIQDLIILAKLILPYEDFKNTLLDSDSKQMTEGLGEKALETAGFIYISKSNTLYQKNKEFIFDFSGSYSPSSDYARDSFYYFNNPDGSMRWIFPVNLKYPTFLGFYNITSWKSKGIAFLIQCAFRLGLQKFIVSGTFDLYSKSEPCFKKYLTNQFSGNYSMFMGTVGPNRKVVFEMNKFGKTTHFAKAALTEAGSALLQNEFYKLDKADDLNLKHISTPYSFLLNDNRLLIQSSVFTLGCVRSKNWTPVHSIAKLEMEEVTISKTVLASDFLLKIKTRVDKIIHTPNLDPLFSSLSIKVKKLCGQVNANTELLPTSFCHNDFTPWNMYLAPGYLKAYDWELAGYAPVLTDLFHFHI